MLGGFTMAELDAVHIRAPAKINLFLRVLAREISGYHQIETLFAAVEFCDELRVERAREGVSLEVVGADVGPEKQNLAYRAARNLLRTTSADIGVRILLTKNIPAGAGLGGGSSDAGATLRALNMLLGNPLSELELIRCAGDLGSDVPFFASGAGRALAWGRGEQLLVLPTDREVAVLLALPSIKVSTADAYEELGPDVRAAPSAHDLGSFERPEWMAEICVNDFEASVFARHAQLGEIRKAMEAQGALTARLSGSGGALFALFDEQRSAGLAQEALSSAWTDVRFVVTRTLADQPSPTLAS
jgi:4-diphosphocytidyl-2-C-methyl-D-erythritol kinase